MNPNLKVYAAVKVNGSVTQWDQTELKHIPIQLARFLLEHDLSGRDFSTLELRLSKRPISWDSEQSLEQDFTQLLASSIHIPTVQDSDPIDDQLPPITYAELFALSHDPIWTSYKSLANKSSMENITGPEYDGIVSRWKAKYLETKYARLI